MSPRTRAVALVTAGAAIGLTGSLTGGFADALATHNDPKQEAGWTYRTGDSNCVWAFNGMNHANAKAHVYSYLAYSVFGVYTSSCHDQWNRAAGNIRLRERLLVGSNVCVDSGLIYTQSTAIGLSIDLRRIDYEPACGSKNITMRAYGQVNNGGWNGGWIYGPNHDYTP
jgi:hypothetical protein